MGIKISGRNRELVEERAQKRSTHFECRESITVPV